MAGFIDGIGWASVAFGLAYLMHDRLARGIVHLVGAWEDIRAMHRAGFVAPPAEAEARAGPVDRRSYPLARMRGGPLDGMTLPMPFLSFSPNPPQHLLFCSHMLYRLSLTTVDVRGITLDYDYDAS